MPRTDEQRLYEYLTPAEKLAHWERFTPATPEMAKIRRRAIRQFKAELRSK